MKDGVSIADHVRMIGGGAARVALLVSLGLLPLAVGGCPSTHDRCVAAVGHIRPPVPDGGVDDTVAACEKDLPALAFLECAPADWKWTSYDQVLDCYSKSGVTLTRPRFNAANATLRSGAPLSPATAAGCAGPPSAAPPKTMVTTPFLPSVHGFRFNNSCTDGSGASSCCQMSPGVVGCCEGMSYGSLDYYRRGMEVPLIARPAVGLDLWNALDGWVKARQREAGWANWAEFLDLTTPTAVAKDTITAGAWPRIKSKIDGGEPALIALGPDSAWVWEAHAAVAWRYAEDGPQKWLWLYDPNHPADDDTWLEWSEADDPIRIREYANGQGVCVDTLWGAMDQVDYFDPGTMAGPFVPSVFTAAQIKGTDGAFVQPSDLASGLYGRASMFRVGASFDISTDIEREALGGSSDRVIGILGADVLPFRCSLSKGPCNPTVETAFHEVYSGIEGRVRPDGTFCYTNSGGFVVPDNALTRFTLRGDCAGPGIVPPPTPGVRPPTEHPVSVRFANVDDDAYVWAGLPTRVTPDDTAYAVCSAFRSSGGGGYCDLTVRLRDFGQVAELIFKVGNSGGFNSRGDMTIYIDGQVAWQGRENDSGWKHTGWTYRAYVLVDRLNGTATEVEVDSCYNLLDCAD